MSKIVLGGGLSGLSAAYYLTKKPYPLQLTLLEATNRTGGWINSNPQQNGIIFEQGPRTIRPFGEAGANTLKLIEELNLNEKILPVLSTAPAAKNRMIYAKGSLHSLPSSLKSLFQTQEPLTKPLIMYLLNDLTARKKHVEDESIYDFINRRFGTEVADYLISPMICGICAGNAKEISVKFLLKQLFEYEQKYGSIVQGLAFNLFKNSKSKAEKCDLASTAKEQRWSIYSFKGGCEVLPEALKNYVKQNNVDIKLNSDCKQIVFKDDKAHLECNNETLTAEHLLATVPAFKLGQLISKQHPELASLLNRIKSVNVAVLNLYFDENLIKEPGFGFLVAPKEELPILGVIYDSCCFPNEGNNTVLTIMMGGAWFEKYLGNTPSNDKVFEIAFKELKRILKININPKDYKVNVLYNCLPQYVVGHEKNFEKINEYIKRNKLPLSVCGASYYGVGINDVILGTKRIVDSL